MKSVEVFREPRGVVAALSVTCVFHQWFSAAAKMPRDCTCLGADLPQPFAVLAALYSPLASLKSDVRYRCVIPHLRGAMVCALSPNHRRYHGSRGLYVRDSSPRCRSSDGTGDNVPLPRTMTGHQDERDCTTRLVGGLRCIVCSCTAQGPATTEASAPQPGQSTGLIGDDLSGTQGFDTQRQAHRRARHTMA